MNKRKITMKTPILHFINYVKQFDKEYDSTPKSFNLERKANKKLYQMVIKKKLGKRKRENETIRI